MYYQYFCLSNTEDTCSIDYPSIVQLIRVIQIVVVLLKILKLLVVCPYKTGISLIFHYLHYWRANMY